MPIKYLVLLVLFLTSLQAKSVTIAVAANVSYAINSIKDAFNKEYPYTKVNIILGSTGKLVALIKNGAPYDILMAADMHYPTALYKDGFALTKPKVYARGSLILFSKEGLDLSKGLSLLNDSKVKKIAIANPKTAPYGKATIEALKKSQLLKVVQKKLIYAQSASQAVTYSLKVANLGFIPKSTLYSPLMQKQKEAKWIEVDPTLYTPIEQGATLLPHAKSSSEAKKFYDFLYSKEAKAIFQKYGYSVDE